MPGLVAARSGCPLASRRSRRKPSSADLLATGAAANVVPSSALSSPMDVPPNQQPQASDAGVSPASVSPDSTPQQSALLYGTRSAGLPLGKVGVDNAETSCPLTRCFVALTYAVPPPRVFTGHADDSGQHVPLLYPLDLACSCYRPAVLMSCSGWVAALRQQPLRQSCRQSTCCVKVHTDLPCQPPDVSTDCFAAAPAKELPPALRGARPRAAGGGWAVPKRGGGCCGVTVIPAAPGQPDRRPGPVDQLWRPGSTFNGSRLSCQ